MNSFGSSNICLARLRVALGQDGGPWEQQGGRIHDQITTVSFLDSAAEIQFGLSVGDETEVQWCVAAQRRFFSGPHRARARVLARSCPLRRGAIILASEPCCLPTVEAGRPVRPLHGHGTFPDLLAAALRGKQFGRKVFVLSIFSVSSFVCTWYRIAAKTRKPTRCIEPYNVPGTHVTQVLVPLCTPCTQQFSIPVSKHALSTI